jgi:hypothetical protein
MTDQGAENVVSPQGPHRAGWPLSTRFKRTSRQRGCLLLGLSSQPIFPIADNRVSTFSACNQYTAYAMTFSSQTDSFSITSMNLAAEKPSG